MRSLLLMQIGAAHSMRSPPPCGEGMGVGGARFLSVAPPSSYRITPLPNPPPQGGREHTEFAALIPIHTTRSNTIPTCWSRSCRGPFLDDADDRVRPGGQP